MTTVIGVVFMVIAVCVFVWGFYSDMNKAAFAIGFITLLIAIISLMMGSSSSVTNNYFYQISDSPQRSEGSQNWTGSDDGAGEFQLTRPPMSTPSIEDEVNDKYIPFDDFE